MLKLKLMTGMQNVRQIYENGQIWSKRLQANQRETDRESGVEGQRGRGADSKRCYALDKATSSRTSRGLLCLCTTTTTTLCVYVHTDPYDLYEIRELAFSTEDEIKPYADFILITRLPHSAWQSGMAKLDQLRATSA